MSPLHTNVMLLLIHNTTINLRPQRNNLQIVLQWCCCCRLPAWQPLPLLYNLTVTTITTGSFVVFVIHSTLGKWIDRQTWLLNSQSYETGYHFFFFEKQLLFGCGNLSFYIPPYVLQVVGLLVCYSLRSVLVFSGGHVMRVSSPNVTTIHSFIKCPFILIFH